MRDDYDKLMQESVKGLSLSCSLTLSFKKIFFGTGVNKYVEDKILAHLFTCQKCREAYIKYAKEIGYKNFNLIKYAMSFIESNPEFVESETREFINQTRGEKVIRILSKPWTRAANNFNITKLMNMKAFRDLANEYDSPTGLDYSQFMKYVILRIAKHVDHLEECLLKEIETEKKNKNEKSK